MKFPAFLLAAAFAVGTGFGASDATAMSFDLDFEPFSNGDNLNQIQYDTPSETLPFPYDRFRWGYSIIDDPSDTDFWLFDYDTFSAGGPVGWQIDLISGNKEATNASLLSGLLIDFGPLLASVLSVDVAEGFLLPANTLNLYAYDENFNQVGSVEDIALGLSFLTVDLTGLGFQDIRYFQAFTVDGGGGLNELSYALDGIMIVAPIPVPASVDFMISGIGGLVVLRSRQKRGSAA